MASNNGFDMNAQRNEQGMTAQPQAGPPAAVSTEEEIVCEPEAPTEDSKPMSQITPASGEPPKPSGPSEENVKVSAGDFNPMYENRVDRIVHPKEVVSVQEPDNAGPEIKFAPEVETVFDEDEEEGSMKPAAVGRQNNSASGEISANDSFASDAVGSGDVAEAMGATLDMVAGVISEMLFEADAHNRQPVKSDAACTSDASGAVILESVQDSKKSDREVANDWHVVGASDSDNESIKQDEEIARAAEMLGSALFHSDLRSSGEIVSTLSDGSASFSSASSVPSTVPSIAISTRNAQVSVVQLARWAAQLSQLRELGFDNEMQCVDIMERLNAANIGVDSDEEVSVTQVVNEILKQN